MLTPTLPSPDAAVWTTLDNTLGLPSVPWTTVATVALAAGGLTPVVDLPLPPGTDTVALRVTDEAGTAACVQLDALLDPAAQPWVTAPATLQDYGTYCSTCPQRVSVGVGGGLYVLPSSDPLPPTAALLQVRAAVRDCSTFLPLALGAAAPARLRIDALLTSSVAATTEGVVPIEVAITPGSSFYADAEPLPTPLAAAVDQVNALLRPGHLTVRVVRVRRVDSVDPLPIESGNHAALDRAFQSLYAEEPGGAAPDDSVVPLILAGCLEFTDPVQDTSSQPAAFTPRIPDGATATGRAHGMWIAGRGCQAADVPVSPSASGLARLIAHELGHTLGLYHSEEPDQTPDRLSDTTADNLMYFRPSANGQGFSAEQFQVMRRHPAVRYLP